MKHLNMTAGLGALAFALAACGGEPADDAAEIERVEAEETAPDTGMTETTGAGTGGAPFWTVTDEDSTVTLFPTIHFLPEDLEWRSAEMEQALAEAEEVWFEILPSQLQDQAAIQPVIMEYGMSQDQPLSERLDEETYAELERVAEQIGFPVAQMEQMRPWLAAVTIGALDLMQDGFQPGSGAEMVLAADVDDSKEKAFETPEEQFSFFANLDEDTEVAFLKSTIEQIDNGQAELQAFAQDWAAGDVSGLEDFIIDGMRDVSEELYQVLLVQRNQRWVDALVTELEGSGTDFVAVGAGHLIGEDGVPEMLAARGYTVEGPGFE
ncbi:TraB/GumN family protein [Parvularcula maris]|uniref:TraB/GumN family protein n=1 Tax=Parvularcula maris TaxID=2965077 RepID=A0A9X2RIB6_9PROT|nr:TraB/GumN family protein [Parvularcula maris]MCQ8184771.1 TraB/GumN family protein [Parvularcula maris]